MLSSPRSPRQPPGGVRRRKPLARRQPSVFNTLKTFVSAPLAWFSQPSETEDTPGKRRRLPQPASDDTDDARPLFQAKRIRLDSPQPDDHNRPGYLDPPLALIDSHPPPQPQRYTNPPPIRQTTLPTTQQRTMSMDPPSRHTAPLRHEPTLVNHPFSRDALTDLSPRPLRIRSTLTPSRPGLDFGPTPQRHDRNPSEPPPLTALMSNPIFVKPPQNDTRRVSDSSTPTTLGALAQQRSGSIPRSHSTLILPSTTDGTPLRPINAAERALHELEVYRTPLVPSRLRSSLSEGSPALSDPLFQSRAKTRSIVLMKREKKDAKPRLGMAHRRPAIFDSPKSKEVKEKGAKPYAGVGGLKKLLARRRQEEKEAEKEKDQIKQQEDDDEQAMANDEGFNGPVKHTSKIAAPPRMEADYSRKVSAPLGPSVASLGVSSSKYPSSLRVGRNGTATGRTVGPTRRPRGRFSAVDDDDDDVAEIRDSGLREKEDGPAETPALPKYEAPTGFTFAKSASSPSITASVPAVDASASTKASDELPIATLPFSFSVSSSASTSDPAAASAILSKESTPLQPTIALIPPTPTPSVAEQPKSSPAPTVPNFFANSNIFAKTTITPSERPMGEEKKETLAPSFSLPTPTPPTSSVLTPIPEPNVVPDSRATTAVVKPVESALAPSPAPFSWGGQTETAPLQVSAAPSKLPSALSNVEEERLDLAPTPAVPDQLKPSLGPGFAGLGTMLSSTAISSTPEVSKPLFSFGAPAPAPAPAVASSTVGAEAAQPLLGDSKSFPFGQTEAESGRTKDPGKRQTTSTFSSGATPATPPPASEKAAGFTSGGQSSTPALTNDAPKNTPFSFAAPATATGFSFGTPSTQTPVRPVTPPRNDKDNEMRMEESPTRDLNTQSKPPLLQLQVPGVGMDFNTGPSPFGQPSGNGFSFGAKADTTSASTASLFSFSKPTETQNSGGFTFGPPKPQETTSGFSFGVPKSAESGFGFGGSKPPETSSPFTFGGPKQAENPATSPFPFGPPKQEASNAFPFTQPPKASDSRPSSSGFAFGAPQQQQQQSQSSTTSGSSPFSFGQPLPSTNAPAFGASAPASPAFGNNSGGTSFSFAGPTSASVQQSNSVPFGFGAGSQPASPAVASGSGGGFSFGGTPSTPSSPFPSAGGSAGGSIFTMGAPPSAAPSGGRQIKKLPTRRGGVKR